MWETLVKPPLGRVSVRKFIVLLVSLFAVCFAYIVATAPVTHAASATWSDGDILYNNRTYSDPQTVSDTSTINLPEGSTYYTSIDSASTPQRAFVIYFAPGVSPPSASSASYAVFDYDGSRFTNKANVAAITVTPQGGDGNTSEGTTSCAVDGIGWIVCPVTNFLAKGMDFIYGVVAQFLEVRPLATTADQAMYRAWDYVRNVANVLFVIGFLVVIYSQVTGIGLSNYSIKKILPRVIIAAVLVNTSYWICAVAIDIFNILGFSIQDVFISVRNSLVGDEGNSWDVISWESLSSVILSGGTVLAGASIGAFLGITTLTTAVAGGGIMGAIFVLLPLLISVLFVVLMTFLILAARQAIITILVILAPVAFVAYLLPNTEEWFTRWRKTLFTLLLVFPAFSFIFGGAQLASAIIIQNATDINMILLAMGVQVAPLAITPLLLKLGGGVLNRFAGVVNNPAKGMFDRSKNWAKDRSDLNMAKGHSALAERAKKYGADKGGRPTDTGGGIKGLARRTRINPANMAYLREYKRREREGTKAASDAMTDSYFAGSSAGARIEHTKKDAQAMQHAYGAMNTESWNRRTYGDPAKGTGPNHIGQLHHSGYNAENRAKIIEDAANDRAAREFQTDLNTNTNPSARVAGLRDLKTRGFEDKGVGAIHENRISADGEHRLREHVLGSQALQQQITQTTDGTNRAKQAESIVQERANAAWEQTMLNDRTIYTRNIEHQGIAKQVKSAQEERESILAEASAGHSDDYARRFGAPTQQITNAISDITAAETKIVAEAKRKAQAETEKQIQINDEFLKNTSQIAGVNIRDYAGGTRDGGAESVLAESVAKFRSEYGRQMGERAELVKHFNLSSADRQKLALGADNITVSKDGVTHTFDKEDFYLREAMVENQLKAGSFGDIEALIQQSVQGGATYDFRTTIAEAIVKNGLASKALYYGSKTIDDVAQGRVNLDDAAAYHLVEGKVKAEQLSGQGAPAIERLFEVANNPARISGFSQWSDEKKDRFRRYVEALPDMAAAILDDPLLNRNTDEASREVLDRFRTPRP